MPFRWGMAAWSVPHPPSTHVRTPTRPPTHTHLSTHAYSRTLARACSAHAHQSAQPWPALAGRQLPPAAQLQGEGLTGRHVTTRHSCAGWRPAQLCLLVVRQPLSPSPQGTIVVPCSWAPGGGGRPASTGHGCADWWARALLVGGRRAEIAGRVPSEDVAQSAAGAAQPSSTAGRVDVGGQGEAPRVEGQGFMAWCRLQVCSPQTGAASIRSLHPRVWVRPATPAGAPERSHVPHHSVSPPLANFLPHCAAVGLQDKLRLLQPLELMRRAAGDDGSLGCPAARAAARRVPAAHASRRRSMPPLPCATPALLQCFDEWRQLVATGKRDQVVQGGELVGRPELWAVSDACSHGEVGPGKGTVAPLLLPPGVAASPASGRVGMTAKCLSRAAPAYASPVCRAAACSCAAGSPGA